MFSKPTSDGQGGATLHLGFGDSVDLVNVTTFELKAHHGDLSFNAGATA